MTDKVTVRISFRHTLAVTKDIEMTRAELEQITEKLDRTHGREYRKVEEDLFARLNVRVEHYDYGANDPEFDDLGEVSNS
jgi:endonuclease IV